MVFLSRTPAASSFASVSPARAPAAVASKEIKRTPKNTTEMIIRILNNPSLILFSPLSLSRETSVKFFFTNPK